MTILDLNAGEQASVVEFVVREPSAGGGRGRRGKGNCGKSWHHIENLGLHPGKVIEVLRIHNNGPVLVKVEQSRIAIGRGMANRIVVKKIDD